MIQLQNYFNSNYQLQNYSLSSLRKKQIKVSSRKLFKSMSEPKAKCQFQIKQVQEQQNVKKGRYRYEQLMKKIRQPLRTEFQSIKSTPQNEKQERFNFIKLKSNRKQKLQTNRSVNKSKNLTIEDQETNQKQQFSTSNIETKRSFNQNYAHKCITKTQTTQKNNSKSICLKPRTTILKKILDTCHLKYVRQILNEIAEQRSQCHQSKVHNSFQLKCSQQALEHIRKQYENESPKKPQKPQKPQKPLKPQKPQKRINVSKFAKLVNFKSKQGQNIAGWTIKQFVTECNQS